MNSNYGRLSCLLALGASLATSACSSQADEPASQQTSLEQRDQAIVYGNDDRMDWYAHPDASLRTLTTNAIVAMVSNPRWQDLGGGNYNLSGQTLGNAYGLCSGERFRDQITAADCSATLIDDDLVLTAGHCVTSQSACQGTNFVFNYYFESEDQMASIREDDVYACEELLVQELGFSNNRNLDYAILRLDRSATPRHQPAVVSRQTSVAVGESVTIIGFGSGIPAKIDNGGRIINTRNSSADYFEATTDSFGGNSGSGVFNTDNEVIGILVRGNQDYGYDSSRGCTIVNDVPDNVSSGEGISYVWPVIEELCDSGYSSARLCGNVTCGDGICASGESSSCPEDCENTGAPVCGDGVCDPNESCDEDCGGSGGEVPGAWVCDPAYYGTADGCDCQCGAYDPDCDNPSQELYNCEPEQYCSSTGVCLDNEEEDPGVPADWTCDPGYYGTADGCDCNCGIFDPDCDDAEQELYNCDFGEYCNDDGICKSEDSAPTDAGSADAGGEEEEEEEEEGGDSSITPTDGTTPTNANAATDGCAAGGSPAQGAPIALLALGALLYRRRR